MIQAFVFIVEKQRHEEACYIAHKLLHIPLKQQKLGLASGVAQLAFVMFKIHSDLTIGGFHHSIFPPFLEMPPTNLKIVRPTLTPPMLLPQLNPM